MHANQTLYIVSVYKIVQSQLTTMASASSATFAMLAAVCALALFLVVAEAQPPKLVQCHDKKGFPLCGGYKYYCPANCPRSCYVDCDLCRPVCACDKPGGVCQDPRFVGGDGITFYFHGKKEQDFCLLSDADLHINAHFIGKRGPAMDRDFTWVQAIAVLFDDNHRLHIAAEKTATWNDAIDRLAVSYDGEAVTLPTTDGATWHSNSLPAVTITRSATANSVTVEAEGKFKITANVVPIGEEESRVHNYGIASDDCFAHLELGFKFYGLTEDVHGVLGQTYREGYVSRVKLSSNMPVMGGEREFSTSGLFAPDCSVARFGQAGTGIAMMSEVAGMKCGSGLGGRGIVCKK